MGKGSSTSVEVIRLMQVLVIVGVPMAVMLFSLLFIAVLGMAGSVPVPREVER
jgi:hypothetical protein